MCSCNDFDMPAIYQSRIVKARKTYRCCECGWLIRIGERYEQVDGLWDGHWGHYRTCERCVDLRGRLDLDCWEHGELWEAAYEAEILDYVPGPLRQALFAICETELRQ